MGTWCITGFVLTRYTDLLYPLHFSFKLAFTTVTVKQSSWSTTLTCEVNQCWFTLRPVQLPVLLVISQYRLRPIHSVILHGEGNHNLSVSGYIQYCQCYLCLKCIATSARYIKRSADIGRNTFARFQGSKSASS